MSMLRSFAVIAGVMVLAAPAVHAQLVATMDYTDFVNNTQPLNAVRWDTQPFGAVTGTEFQVSDGLVFTHLNGTGLQNQDDVGSAVDHTDTTTEGHAFMYGLGTNAGSPGATNQIRIDRTGTGAPGFTAIGLWLIDAEIYRSPASTDNRLVVSVDDGQGVVQQTYDLSKVLPAWTSGGTLDNVLFFGFYIADPVGDLSRITGVDVYVGNSVIGNEQSSIAQVEYSDNVPEPATMGLLTLGAVGLLKLRRRRK